MNRKKFINPFGKNFIILPLVFVIINIFIFSFVMWPILKPTFLVFDMFFLPETISENNKVIYDPSIVVPKEGTINLSDLKFPALGDQFGKITVQGTGIQDVDLYFGDSQSNMRHGAGVYNGSKIPGGGGTTLISAHNTTHFFDLQYAKVNGVVNINTNYGNYVYKITTVKPAEHNDASAYSLSNTEDGLILYTCYPFDRLGFKTQRYFVRAEYVSGPKIIYDK